MTRPYYFTLQDADGWFLLYEWLRDEALFSQHDLPPTREYIQKHLGPDSPSYHRDTDTLRELFRRHASLETIRVKRRLWHDLLRAALGEVAGSGLGRGMDDLFVRHTYLTTVVGMVVQASFGIDIRALAETEAENLVYGREFQSKTGLQGVVESDFFAWPAEVGGAPLLRAIARRVARFDWLAGDIPNDIASILYETVIPAEERRTLGEYYTPQWLAKSMVRELVDDPLEQTVLDPACGSGTFVAEAISNYIDAAEDSDMHESEVFGKLRDSVTGIDIHPVAVHLARAAYVLVARKPIQDAGYTSVTVPIYLGDALQLRYRAGDMFSEHEVTIQVGDKENTELVFPVSLVERPDTFDAFMSDVAKHIEGGDDPTMAFSEHHIVSPEQKLLSSTVGHIQRLHAEGRDHIWAYYTRNMVRPAALSRSKVDIIIGNPPWINYNQTVDVLRTELERLSSDRYGIWTGGRYATHQDVAGLFFARCVDLYLEDSGAIGFVMPHSALQAGQYSKWRTGRWRVGRTGPGIRVDFTHKAAWDLERLQPNSFFPVPASVVFARRIAREAEFKPLAGTVMRWYGNVGKAGVKNLRREPVTVTDTGVKGDSPYTDFSRQGATIVPRALFFVNETDNPAIVQAARTVTVNPRRGSQDKAPWKNLDLTAITGQTIEDRHLFDIHLGETVAPYVTLEPLKALLPLKRGASVIPISRKGAGGVRRSGLQQRMRDRWKTVSELWEENRARANKLSLVERLDYVGNLSAQLDWQSDPHDRPVRLVYTTSGRPTAALVRDNQAVIDNRLFWVTCKDRAEADYLLAIINSNSLEVAVEPLMSKGQFGARDLHKHLWKLPIPEFDSGVELHAEIAAAGAAAAVEARWRLTSLRKECGADVGVTIVRRELRAWLRGSAEGAAVGGG